VYSTTSGVWKIPATGGINPLRSALLAVSHVRWRRRYCSSRTGIGPRAVSSWDIVRSMGSVHDQWLPISFIWTGGLFGAPGFVHARTWSEGWYVAGNRTPTSPGYLMFFSVPAADSSESAGADASGFGMSLSPDGRSLLYAKFVSLAQT